MSYATYSVKYTIFTLLHYTEETIYTCYELNRLCTYHDNELASDFYAIVATTRY